MKLIALGFLLSLLVVGCVACASQHMPGTAAKRYRTPAEQIEATVKIVHKCGHGEGWGSGVLVSSKYVLTAHHVVKCSGVPNITVERGNVTVNAYVEAVSEEHDIARLRLAVPMESDRARVGLPPMPDQTVSISTAVPLPDRRNGWVHPHKSKFKFDANVYHGNSGSGIYNLHGELIGIVTHLQLCFPTNDHRFSCGGLGTTIGDKRWILPTN